MFIATKRHIYIDTYKIMQISSGLSSQGSMTYIFIRNKCFRCMIHIIILTHGYKQYGVYSHEPNKSSRCALTTQNDQKKSFFSFYKYETRQAMQLAHSVTGTSDESGLRQYPDTNLGSLLYREVT